MDEKTIVTQLLESYEEISIVGEDTDIIFFKLFNKDYGLWYPMKDNRMAMPLILVKNEDKYNYPHILPFDIPLDQDKQDKYRYICLYENENTIKYLQSYDEKITDAVERLIKLLSLAPLEIEREFQKEFLYYWNDLAENQENVSLYIGEDRIFKRMNAYYGINSDVRFVADGINLTDKEEQQNGRKIWKHNPNLPVYYIPIIDNRRVIPPTRDHRWDYTNILMIINGIEYKRISHECYLNLSKEKVKAKSIGLVFEMIVDENIITFTSIINFKHSSNDFLLNKIKSDIAEVRIIKSKRIDYYYLCHQIGNDTSLLDKKILLIGAGSLGSYVASELVKAGIRNLTIYDSDKLEEDNLLRHIAKKFWIDSYKVNAAKFDLEMIHPEIHINAVSEDIDEKSLRNEMNKYDLIIFTVGSSDIQLMSNKVFVENGYNKPVIYAWLEAGGSNSHLLSVNYSQKGCYECLFTDEDGNLINNKANELTDIQVQTNTLSNGCGATRVAYGTEILLRTTSVLLDTVKTVFSNIRHDNFLIDIKPEYVINKGNSFLERKCQCCGDKDRE